MRGRKCRKSLILLNGKAVIHKMPNGAVGGWERRAYMATGGIVTNYNRICIFCGKPAECEHHLLFGNGVRELAEQDGLKVPACNECHNIGRVTGRIHDNIMAEKLSKMLGQAIYEAKVGSREEFRARYGKSYF